MRDVGLRQGDQVTEGIHMRLRSRAFVIVDEASGRRVLLSISELPMISAASTRQSSPSSSRASATSTRPERHDHRDHTHCGPGGYSHHLLYNTNTHGFVKRRSRSSSTASWRPHPARTPTLLRPTSPLHWRAPRRQREPLEAGVRARSGRRQGVLPDGNDPQITVLRIGRAGRPLARSVGSATHNTSMTSRNRLISSDNKGYASYHWERGVEGVNYLSEPEPDFIAAFAQTNAGDMSPNLNLHRKRPDEDQFENTRIIGLRQFDAAAKLVSGDAGP